MKRAPNFLKQLLPYISLGIFIVLVIIGILFLSYILIIGAIIGLALFIIGYLKAKFFPTKFPQRPQQSQPPSRQGRIFDHNEFK